MSEDGEKQRDNSASQQRGLVNFTKDDPRINRKGRPKTLKALRKRIQEICAEPFADNPEWTLLDAMLQAMTRSKSAADRQQILRYGWGEPTERTPFMHIDLSTLSDEAIERIANGEDVLTVIAGKGASGNRKAEAAADADPEPTAPPDTA